MPLLRLLLTIVLCLAVVSCSPGPEKAAEEEAPAAASASREQLFDEARQHFVPTKEEAEYLDAGPAVNIIATENGYYTNQSGVTGYFFGYTMPFNFMWSGATKTVAALDGQTYQLMDGPGTVLLKYLHDDLLLQRYEGEMREGKWHGYGTSWVRNENGDYNSYFYQGEFQYDNMEGRGIYRDYDYDEEGYVANPTEYRGEFRSNDFRGFGVKTDLVTGQVIWRGLWYANDPYEYTKSQWQFENTKMKNDYPLYNEIFLGRVYSSTNVEWDTSRDEAPPSHGLLTLIFPPDAKNAETFGPDGQPLPVDIILHPHNTQEDGSDLYVIGFTRDFSQSDFPMTFTMLFEHEGNQKAGLRFTARAPLTLELLEYNF